MSTSVLLIEDDEKICDLLSEYLAQHDFQCKAFQNPVPAIEVVDRHSLIILDVMLPEMDGFEVLKRIRKTSDIPVIMLTARGETTDKIVGLELGADDYLSKPFEPRELVARMNSILRRRSSGKGSQTFGKLVIHRQHRRVEVSQKEVALSALEFDLLDLLSQQPGKKWTRDEIMNALHGQDSDVFSRAIDVAISRLRQKLGDARYIQTIWGTGYSFIGEVE